MYKSKILSVMLLNVQVLVMTPVILLNCLRHSFLKLNMIKVLILDECHHARGKHPYACIMTVSISFSLNWAVSLNFLLFFYIIVYLSSDFFINMLYYYYYVGIERIYFKNIIYLLHKFNLIKITI